MSRISTFFRKTALSGGVPMGRWKEGLLFEGVRPMPG